jgi:hypothetical protein
MNITKPKIPPHHGNRKLNQKIQSETPLSSDDRDMPTYLLLSIKRSLENINYFIIFVFSILTIANDVALHVFWKT